MRRTECGSCGSDDLRVVLDLGMSPVADAYTNTADELSLTYPLELAVCENCRLVQLMDVLPHDVLFGTGYSFFSSASPPLSVYHERYANDVMHLHRDALTVLEIGCNDGDMLRHFRDAGKMTLGVDPAGAPVKMARESRGLNVHNVSFTSKYAEQLRETHGDVDLIIANHVLAHVENVADMLCGISALLKPNGSAYVEVQYLPDLLLNNAFDLAYHEHRNFFSLTSLEAAANRWGLYVRRTWLTDRQGGSLRVQLTRKSQQAQSPRTAELRARESWLRDPAGSYIALGGLQGRAERLQDRLLSLMHDEIAADRYLIGYGAPAKATTLLNFCGIDNTLLPVIIDSTPAKQGRFVPGTGIQIRDPERVPLTDETYTVVALAWNYLPTLMRKHQDFTQRGGRWLTPVPSPMLL